MDLNLKDKIAVITGGSKGIGLATATLLAAEGARVVVGSRTTPVLPTGVLAVPVDLSVAGGPASLVAAAVEAHGGIDLLVNNVARSEPAPSIGAFSDEQWQRIFDLTFFAAVRTTRAAVPAMLGRDGASIVNVSSLNARLPAGMIAPYSAAKAALTNLGTALSEELAPQGIRVNTVSPGPVRTPMWTDPGAFASVIAPGVAVDEVMNRVLPEAMSITTGRVSEPDEVAGLIAFLAGPHAANITGADLVIDGGMLKTA
ncbi:MAG: SDR family oxidoreductase [Actinophytocola sp.]|uniref:SDR family NAD(P)-dependent oxidoreductase n=1 Tax=Actinophytocola sp. TaxID=1872138 RepID=UPI001323940E|nr:SDR family oxidoreductase [Actinophytocola sp.]MPZ83114.1 SDR family oxidoreductase [Actinophytocola sp.]